LGEITGWELSCTPVRCYAAAAHALAAAGIGAVAMDLVYLFFALHKPSVAVAVEKFRLKIGIFSYFS
jgi:hypothetical protein